MNNKCNNIFILNNKNNFNNDINKNKNIKIILCFI